jgi:hypothetical protein
MGSNGMRVSELAGALHELPDQDATVVIRDGMKPDVRLIVCVRARRAKNSPPDDNPDFAGPGDDPGDEIV